MRDPMVLGVVEREGDSAGIAYLTEHVPLSEDLVAAVAPVRPGQVMRLAARCEKAACKQRAYRLRHQPQATVDPAVLRKQLQRKSLLVDHTVYECPSCQERFLGERRCPDCHLFARAVGLGGSCPDCETVILLADLLELEGMAPA